MTKVLKVTLAQVEPKGPQVRVVLTELTATRVKKVLQAPQVAAVLKVTPVVTAAKERRDKPVIADLKAAPVETARMVPTEPKAAKAKKELKVHFS